MSIQTDIKKELTVAMLAKESIKVEVLRSLVAAFVNELVAKRRKPNEELSDEDALSVIRRQAKQRKESIEQFRMAGREDLAKSEETELGYLETYLPQMMSREDIRAVVEKKKQELGITDKSGMGKLMGSVMQELKGKADGNDVKEVVAQALT
ncbi:MAG: GatB/YqeY domain-containing protein [bacterium]|nr:GatB/YqeY domain-containing protein [bacterium]